MLLLSIKSRSDFLALSQNRAHQPIFRFYSSTTLVLAGKSLDKYLINPHNGKIDDFCRVGYTVTKKIGNAVKRNKVKRRYREAFRALYQECAKNHYDYVILARKDIADAKFEKIYSDLKFCLKGINYLVNKHARNKTEQKPKQKDSSKNSKF